MTLQEDEEEQKSFRGKLKRTLFNITGFFSTLGIFVQVKKPCWAMRAAC